MKTRNVTDEDVQRMIQESLDRLVANIHDNSARLVTLNEMYDIYASDMYKAFREANDLEVEIDPNGNRCVSIISPLVLAPEDSPLLYKHIVAEQLLQEDCEQVDWEALGVYKFEDFYTLYMLWLYPLVWLTPSEHEELVVDGRLAAEQYVSTRWSEIDNHKDYVNEHRLLCFANKSTITEWIPLTQNWNDAFYYTPDDVEIEERSGSIKPFDTFGLRYNLQLIASRLGGNRAAELLRGLQKDWKKIKLWEKNFYRMTPEEIQDFEDALYSGFDELLEEWEGEKPSALMPPKKSKRPNYELLLDWLEEEKKQGRDYLKEANYNRSEMCRNLSHFLGWEVNENSLQKAEKRRR